METFLDPEVFFDDFLARLRVKLVYYFARRVSDSERNVAEDLAQETSLKFFTSFDPVRALRLSPQHFQSVCHSYLWKSAKTVLVDYYRHRLSVTSDQAALQREGDVEGLRQHLTEDQFKERLASLPAETIRIFCWRLVDGLTFPEITDLVNEQRRDGGKRIINESAIRMRFKRAREIFGLTSNR